MGKKIIKVLVDGEWYTLDGEFGDKIIQPFMEKLIKKSIWQKTKEEVYINSNKISGFKLEEIEDRISNVGYTPYWKD